MSDLNDLAEYLAYLRGEAKNGPMREVPEMREHVANLERYMRALDAARSTPKQGEATTADTAPIAKINVHDGRIILAEFYAPGLPDGEHDLWPVRVTLTEEDEALAKAAEALVRAADKCAAPPPQQVDPAFDWRLSAFAVLGRMRDRMSLADVIVVQDFLDAAAPKEHKP